VYAVAESLVRLALDPLSRPAARGHGRQPEALAPYTHVTSADPSNGLAWFHIAEMAFKDGRLDAAEQAYTRALETPAAAPFSASGVTHQGVPLPAYAALGLARVAIERGQNQQARARLEPIVAIAALRACRALLGQIQVEANARTIRPCCHEDCAPTYRPPIRARCRSRAVA
jgi:tetratricopeptide (TPR) repeat protein